MNAERPDLEPTAEMRKSTIRWEIQNASRARGNGRKYKRQRREILHPASARASRTIAKRDKKKRERSPDRAITAGLRETKASPYLVRLQKLLQRGHELSIQDARRQLHLLDFHRRNLLDLNLWEQDIREGGR